MSVLLVSKHWYSGLHRKIIKRYLISEPSGGLIEKMRLKVYRQVCSPPFSRTVYLRMVE